jgi:oxalate decarboxylase
MKGASFLSSALALCLGTGLVAAAPKDAQQPGFDKGQPYNGNGKGSVILGNFHQLAIFTIDTHGLIRRHK